MVDVLVVWGVLDNWVGIAPFWSPGLVGRAGMAPFSVGSGWRVFLGIWFR